MFSKENSYVNDNKKSLHYLSISILISLTVKLILATALFNSSINSDGILYITAAKHYANGEFAQGLSLYPMPVYPLLLVFVHFLIPDWILSGHIISIASMILATIPLYYITKTLFGIKPAFWACIIFAFLPEFNQWALYISRDALFLFVFGSCIYFGLQSFQRTNLFLFVLTFILAWTSIVIRIEGVLFIFIYFCALIVFAIIRKELRSHFLLRVIIWAGIPLLLTVILFLAVGSHALAVNRFNQVFLELCKLFNGSFTEKYHQIYEFFAQAENHAPFSGWKYNFAAMARHYMPIIYLMGIMQVISKIIFPTSCIPLIIGLKNRITTSGLFILTLGLFFVLLVLYSTITRDFIASRFLMIPAFLLLPWIGLGFDRLCKKINTKSYKKIIIVLISIIILVPTIKTLKLTIYKDNTVPIAALWMNKNIQSNKIKIVTNSKEASFYIKLKQRENIDWEILFYEQGINYKGIEKYAFDTRAQLIVLKIKNKHLKHLSPMESYKKIKSISSRKFTTNIYKNNSL